MKSKFANKFLGSFLKYCVFKGKIGFIKKILTWLKHLVFKPIYKGNLIIHYAAIFN